MTNPFFDPNNPFNQCGSIDYNKRLIKSYLNFDIHKYNQELIDNDDLYWTKIGEQKALSLFQLAAKNVPAYKDFLKTNGIKPSLIKTIKDFVNVPTIDKKNYISHYSLEDMSWNGRINNSNIISYSSGSSGIPFLWPRGVYQDYEGALQFEHMLTSRFDIHRKNTLIVNCFSMGNYVAGVYVYTSCKLLSQKGYPLTVVSPGINEKDVFDILTRIDSKYDQVILAGYPPFIRNLIDTGIRLGYNFNKLKLKFLFASEFFTESWREYTLSLTGTTDVLADSLNIYGTADVAIFSFETSSCILIKQMTEANRDLNIKLFGSNLNPTIVQFNPATTYYETHNQDILITVASGIPLIRYNLMDIGGIRTKKQILALLKETDTVLYKEFKSGIEKYSTPILPYLFIMNRKDMAVSFYAIMIFPEYVRSGIEDSGLRSQLSGRFVLESSKDGKDNPRLIIHAELNPDVKYSKELEKIVLTKVIKSLKGKCSEYAFLLSSVGKKANPIIKLHPNRNEEFFKIGIKQKWIQK